MDERHRRVAATSARTEVRLTVKKNRQLTYLTSAASGEGCVTNCVTQLGRASELLSRVAALLPYANRFDQ